MNLSSLQLAEAGLLDDLDEALADSGLDPRRLCVEITETAMLHETATVRANMAGIHRRGIRVAIDDFGTGYASLTYLRRYPVDVVKLDRSFVANLGIRPQDEHITAGIIDLARRLGISVTAEGVERPEQAELLRSLGLHRRPGLPLLQGGAAGAARGDARRPTPPPRLSGPTDGQRRRGSADGGGSTTREMVAEPGSSGSKTERSRSGSSDSASATTSSFGRSP